MPAMLETLVRSRGPAARIVWTRLRRGLPVLVAVLVTAAVTGTATRVLVGRGDEARLRARNVVGEKLFSQVLDEKRRLLVHLPDSYALEPARRYPVLYVLDGGRQDVHTAAAAQVMARIGSAPEMLVVGLPNVNRGTRWRDYTPPYPREEADGNGPGDGNLREADRFLRHLETEVIPLIERRYRTQPGRMIAGHSLGGLFVLYTLFERPDLFQARFAYSPSVWISAVRLRAELERSLKAKAAPSGFLYLSLGDREPIMAEAFERFTAILRQLAPPAFRWRADITRGAEHTNNDLLSTPVALQAYYRP